MRKVLKFVLLALVLTGARLQAGDQPALPDYSQYEVAVDRVQSRPLLHPDWPCESATFYDDSKTNERPNSVVVFKDDKGALTYAEWISMADKKIRGYVRKEGAWVFEKEGPLPEWLQ